MSEIKDGGPAFPNPALANEGFSPSYDVSGMTLRDWFAGQALAGLASNCTDAGLSTWLPDSIGARAYQYADAMIAAREGGEK
jgi:hypothetical protein